MTPSTERIVRRVRAAITVDASSDAVAGQLVIAMLNEESLAGACLKHNGITLPMLQSGALGSDLAEAMRRNSDSSHCAEFAVHDSAEAHPEFPRELSQILTQAGSIARRYTATDEISTEHLLLAVTEQQFRQSGRFGELKLTPEMVAEYFEFAPTSYGPPIPFSLAPGELDDHVSPEKRLPEARLPAPAADALWRPIDANLNRAREGLRVLEDYARFVLDNADLTGQLKTLRHSLVAEEVQLRSTTVAPLPFRDTHGDVGTSISTDRELSRMDASDIIAANFRRVQEALRSLEEFGKIYSSRFALQMKALRYQCYESEQSFPPPTQTSRWQDQLTGAAVYVLLTEELCHENWKTAVEQIIEAGGGAIQLREKNLSDREIVRRGQWIADAVKDYSTLFIMNDRPDLALHSRSAGVHVGQTETSVKQCRDILKPDHLVGVSAHSLQEALKAQSDGADYLGVGPVFPSLTKHFDTHTGLELIQQAAAAVTRPWFAIGGISLDNVEQVTAAGATAIAVCKAVIGSDRPGQMVKEFLAVVNAESTDPESTGTEQ